MQAMPGMAPMSAASRPAGGGAAHAPSAPGAADVRDGCCTASASQCSAAARGSRRGPAGGAWAQRAAGTGAGEGRGEERGLE